MIEALRQGRWATRDRLVPAGVMAIAGYLVVLGYLYLYPGILTAPGGTAVVSDFLSFWVAAREAVGGAPATPYKTEDFAALQAIYIGAGHYFAFFYPPTFLLMLLPLGLLSGVAAYWVFQILASLAAGWACGQIMRHWHGFLLAAALPTSFNTYFYGQNSLLAAAFLGAGLVMLAERRHILAGVFIGLMTFKPQLGVLIPFALIAGGYGRAFLAAAVTTVLLAVLSWFVFGTGTWEAFLAQTAFARQTLDHGLVDLHKMISVYAAARQVGAPIELAYGLQILTALGALVAVWVAWRGRAPLPAKAIVLVAAGLLATPFALSYDLALLAVALAFLLRFGQTEGLPPWSATLALVVVLMAAGTRFAGEVGFPFLGPILLVITLWIGWRCANVSKTGAAATA
jgi:hypothetical protein